MYVTNYNIYLNIVLYTIKLLDSYITRIYTTLNIVVYTIKLLDSYNLYTATYSSLEVDIPLCKTTIIRLGIWYIVFGIRLTFTQRISVHVACL